MGTRQGVFISPILFTFFLWILHINEHHLYNIYTEQAVIYQGPSGSHFGYALKIIFNEEHHSQLWYKFNSFLKKYNNNKNDTIKHDRERGGMVVKKI